MKKFLALFIAPTASFESAMSASPEEQKAWMGEWEAWMNKVKSSTVDMGGPLGKTKEVSPSGVSDTKNQIGGYMIVEAASHDEAAALFEDGPHFKLSGATVQVMEVVPMPSA